MMSQPQRLPFPAAPHVAVWLWTMCSLIVLMVGVGGITRITESGLSMVRWEPIKGAIAPQTEAAWQQAFEEYKIKAGAQFEKFSADREMTLQDYKKIYFWEYVHRVIGRLIGVAYFFPMLYFLIRHKIPRPWVVKLLVGLFLGGAQGLLGWFMVTSGFADKPYVSHFRLAAHLSLALFVLAYLLWLILDLIPFWTHRRENYHNLKKIRLASGIWLGLLTLQIVYGAFTAGLRAGYMHNTYPKMGRGFFPPDGIHERFGSVIGNLFHNPSMIQFVHRHLGLLVLVLAILLWAAAMKKRLTDRQKIAFNLLLIFISLQFVLGIFTLVSGMNLVLAVAHQVCACFVLGSGVMIVHELTPPKTVTSRRS